MKSKNLTLMKEKKATLLVGLNLRRSELLKARLIGNIFGIYLKKLSLKDMKLEKNIINSIRIQTAKWLEMLL